MNCPSSQSSPRISQRTALVTAAISGLFINKETEIILVSISPLPAMPQQALSQKPRVGGQTW